LRDEGASQEEQAVEAEMAGLVREAVANLWPRLDQRERDIVRERLLPEDLGDGVSLAALGRRMGVTRERVRQIEVGLKAKLRCEVRTLTGEVPLAQPCGQVCPCAA
jgi:RNA polymerase sigma-32 factor